MTGDSRRILVISFFYPPDQAVGGRRVAKFAQYLPEFGWEPTILTAATTPAGAEDEKVVATPWWSPWADIPGGDGASARTTGDESQGTPDHAEESERPRQQAISWSQRAESGGRLIRAVYGAARHFLPLSTVRMPDATLGWIPHAVHRGLELLRTHRFDALLSSFGPPSSHIVAARLQARSRLPWIADFRDLWSENHWDYRIPPFRWVERVLELRVLRGVSAITTGAPRWANRLERLHSVPTRVVYNGFDPADYPAEPAPSRASDSETAQFNITYVGSLYWPEQDPSPLFAAVSRLQDSRSSDLDDARFQLHFLGTRSSVVQRLARSFGVTRRVRSLPQVDHRECLAAQRHSSALLLLGWNDTAEGVVPAKLFEYLGACRPILGVGPDAGAVSELLRESGHDGLSADPAKIAGRLEGWLDEFIRVGRIGFKPNQQAIERYTRRRQTERMAEVLDSARGAGGERRIR